MKIIYLSFIIIGASLSTSAIPIKFKRANIEPSSREFKENGRQLGLESLVSGLVGNLINALVPNIQTALTNAITNISFPSLFRDNVPIDGLDQSKFDTYLVNIPNIGSFVIVSNKNEKPDDHKPSYAIKPTIDVDTIFKPNYHFTTPPPPTTTTTPPPPPPPTTHRPAYVAPYLLYHKTTTTTTPIPPTTTTTTTTTPPPPPPPTITTHLPYYIGSNSPPYTKYASDLIAGIPEQAKGNDVHSKLHQKSAYLSQLHQQLKDKADKLINDTIQHFAEHSQKLEHLHHKDKPDIFKPQQPSDNDGKPESHHQFLQFLHEHNKYSENKPPPPPPAAPLTHTTIIRPDQSYHVIPYPSIVAPYRNEENGDGLVYRSETLDNTKNTTHDEVLDDLGDNIRKDDDKLELIESNVNESQDDSQKHDDD